MRAVRIVSLSVLLLLAAAALTWLGVLAVLYQMQDALVFPAPGGIDRGALDQSAAELGVTPLDLVAADGTAIYAWHRAGARPGACAILYLHGNGDTVAGSAQLNRYVTSRGCDFLTLAYRGYPGSPGRPTEEGLAQDARAGWDWLVARGIPADRIGVHGQSLGGAVAVRLASEVSPGLLVLEATFTSLADVATGYYPFLPVRRLLRHRFPSLERLKTMRLPVLVAHSRDDQTIPVSHGRALAAGCPGSRYAETSLWGHSDSLVLADPSARDAYGAGLSWLLASERPPSPWP